MLRIHFHVGEHRKVISSADAAQMSFQITLQRTVGTRCFRQRVGIFLVGEKLEATFFEERFLGGKRAVGFVLRG